MTAHNDYRLASLETVFKALADRTRLRILGLLLGGEVCVCHIHESLDVPQPTASRHLAYLRRAGLVEGRKDGLWVHYSLASLQDPVMRTLVNAAGHAIGHVDSAKQDRRRLGQRIERPTPRRIAPASTRCCTQR